MKRNFSRVLSIVLCVVLCLSMTAPAYAANDLGITFTATLDTPTITASAEEQTVIMRVAANPSMTVDGIGFSVTKPSDFTIVSISGGDKLGAYDSMSTDLAAGDAVWSSIDNFEAANVSDVTEFAVITFKVPANTAAGTYEVGVNSLVLTKDYTADQWETDGSAYTTLTIKDATPAGYTAALSTSSSNNEVVSEGNITVNVGVAHSSDTVFNAGEIVLEYDSSKLTLDTTSLGDLKYTNENGKLTVEDFGADKSFATDNYAIKFTAVAVDTETTTEVKLTSAAFIHKDNASANDLIAATNVPLSLDVTIKVAMVNVTLTNTTDSSSTTESIPKGQDYTFAPTDTGNYTYSDVTATVDGNPVTITPNGDNTSFTIAGADVTGDIEISYTKSPNQYKVTVKSEPEGYEDKVDLPDGKPTYGTNYVFRIPENTPNTEVDPGYNYSVVVTVNGNTYSPDKNGLQYTVLGNDISGDIEITLEVEKIPATGLPTYEVTIEGSTDVKVNGKSSDIVTKGDTAILTLTPETGYTYIVKIGDKEIMNNETTTYELTVTENVTVEVTKTLDVSSVTITEYVKVDEYVVYLVTYDGTLVAGKVPTYDGNVMFWSEKYDAYCWLVIDGALTEEAAKAKVEAKTASAPVVDYGMDINGTGVTDAADAQLVWNMYNAMYSDFTSVIMAKFLNADQNATETANWGLNVQDALVIIEAILAGNATT